MPGMKIRSMQMKLLAIGLTGHVDGVREKVSEIRNEDDEAALGLGKSSHIGELKHQRCPKPYQYTNDQASEKDTQEGADGLKEGQEAE